jgi:outer membrane immunogenic protein
MRRLLVLAALCAAVSVQVASAADMPTKAPAYKAVEPIPYNWSGFYIGGHLGGAWSNSDRSSFNTDTGALLDSATQTATSFIGGGQIGFNWMFAPNWLVGIEADISAADLSANDTTVTATTVNHANKIDYFGTVRGRLGYAWQNWLLYGTGGYAWAHDTATRTQLIGTVNADTPGTVETPTNTLTGWTAGGGLEWGFAGNWSARVEYLFMDFGTDSFIYPGAHRRDDYNTHVSVARVGLNYRFDWGR